MVGTRKVINTAINLAILLASGLLCWILVTHRSPHFGPKPIAEWESSILGQTLPPLPGYRWESHPKTLVLAIRKDCHVCEDSLPFYKQLGDLEKSNRIHAHMLAVMPDDRDSGTRTLLSSGVTVEGIFSQKLGSIQVQGTPTLLLLDANGRVARAWVGSLTPQREKEVIDAVE